MLAITTWCLGEVARAERYSEQAEAWARKLAHPFSTVWGLTYGAILHYFRGDALRVRETVEALVLVTQEQGFSFYLGAGSIMRGWAVAETSSAEDGITEICDGLALFDATGGAVASSGLLAMLARAYQRAGRLDEAQRTLERAMTFAEQRNERFYEAELQRLQGELLLKRVDSSPFRVDSTVNCQLSTVDFSDAEACFRRALDTARAQEAKAWELRAALSLARLWRADGRRRDAWELLTPICGWFGDRGDTADVQAARRVLEELR
jgi:predicted ATPase